MKKLLIVLALSSIGTAYAQTTPTGALVNPAPDITVLCTSGYTATIRPPVTFTNRIKYKLLRANNLSGSIADYELDHFIPLELGGNPKDINNLWMQKWSEARIKDQEETSLHKAVCAGKINIKDAQAKIVKDWSK